MPLDLDKRFKLQGHTSCFKVREREALKKPNGHAVIHTRTCTHICTHTHKHKCTHTRTLIHPNSQVHKHAHYVIDAHVLALGLNSHNASG